MGEGAKIAIPGGNVDAEQLERELRGKIRGEVRFDAGSRALYATDGSNYRQTPIGVVIPRDAADVIETVSLCRRYRAPVLARGGGTSLTGSCCNVAVVLDMSKYMNKVQEINVREKWARVEPGTICDTLANAAEAHGLTFGPKPSTHDHCVIGGMIGNNSCGAQAQMAGRTADNVLELDVLTYDGVRMTVGETTEEELEWIIKKGGPRGEIYAGLKALRDRYAEAIRAEYPRIPRRVSGYNLEELLPENRFNVARALVGSEGTCAIVLGAKVRLVYNPRCRTLVLLGFDDIVSAADRVPDVVNFGPVRLEAMDDKLIHFERIKGNYLHGLSLLPEGKAFLMVELGGETKDEADAKALLLIDHFVKNGHPKARVSLADHPEKEAWLWKVREGGLGATAFVPGYPDAWEGWEDAAVPPDQLGSYLRGFQKLLDEYGYQTSLYGHFGQGCVHCRIDFDLFTAEGVAKYRRFARAAAQLVVEHRGSLSGEHGDGQSRGWLLPIMYGPALMEAFREFKRIWDPLCLMNPGKKIDPYPVDANLRIGPKYNPKVVDTHFEFAADGHNFAHAALRCVGVGECRRLDKGTMCPSFRVTREEMHSTRGRTHLLFEMLRGETITKGWRDPHVREALDLCLSCKGCKGDCPVNVDVATYKAEFLAHYYKGRLRPRAAYSIGLVDKWARLGSKFPGLANWVANAPGLGGMLKAMGGVTSERAVPRFADVPFTEQFRRRPQPLSDHRQPVLFWPDTFNNYFHPDVAMAAVEVLEDAGFQVYIPGSPVCCGRPLYDYGLLPTAKEYLLRTLAVLGGVINEGMPVVGIEPSCMAVFRDELLNLLPRHESAKRLARQTFMLSDFLVSRGYEPPPLEGKAIVQGHCHQKAIFTMQGEKEMLRRLGLEATILDSGCCGLAGSFGFEREHYDISVAIGEYEMAPQIRKAPADTFVLTNGFSCHTQIEHLTERKPLHIAQVLREAIRRKASPKLGAGPGEGALPEKERAA